MGRIAAAQTERGESTENLKKDPDRAGTFRGVKLWVAWPGSLKYHLVYFAKKRMVFVAEAIPEFTSAASKKTVSLKSERLRPLEDTFLVARF